MRTIKFRAWDKVNKKMIGGFGIDSTFGYAFIKDFDLGEEYILECEIMQFTGLTDKNGKEIYEGDIVVGIHYEDFDTGIGINTLSEECKPFEVKWDENVYGWNLYGSDDFRVIGNIYEIPNLLN